MQTLVVGSTNLIELGGFQDTTDLSYPQNATVVCDLFDAANHAVSGATALPMPFIAGTAGLASVYRGAIAATVALVVGACYTARITATDAFGNVRLFPTPCIAVAGS